MEMTTERAIEVLVAHNEWRRDNDIPNSKAMVDPTELGKALDKAIEVMGIDYTKIINGVEDYYQTTTNSDEYKEGTRNACDMIDFRIKIKQNGFHNEHRQDS